MHLFVIAELQEKVESPNTKGSIEVAFSDVCT